MDLDAYNDLLHRCFRCGYCKFPSEATAFNCPSYQRFRKETYAPGGRLWLIRAVATGGLVAGRHYAHILYSCSMCGNCKTHCCLEFKDSILDMVRAARAQLVDQSILPSGVQAYLENLYTFNNPWKKPIKKRVEWARSTQAHDITEEDRYLFYVGDTGSYHPRAQKVTQSISRLMDRAGVDYGILGKEERPHGNQARDLGETALFEHFRDMNMATFQKKNIKQIFTYTPHAYHAMRHHYPLPTDTVSHYLDLLFSLLSSARLPLSPLPDLKITYHDSCFLGRWNQKYDLPRQILDQIPGVRRVEMERNRENALCCGGGSAQFFTDLLGNDENSPARTRVREALATGAGIIAVSCPICLIMLEDAIETENLGHRLRVLDIAEILTQSVFPNATDASIPHFTPKERHENHT